jgi:predicted metal-binding protein
MDLASRTVQARTSTTYPGASAQDMGLNGSGVNIAVIDTGVSDTVTPGMANKFVAGYDAWDSSDNGDGTRNPTDQVGNHCTTMAVVAMSTGSAGKDCRNPGGGNAPSCAGVAPGAKLIDVNRCGATFDTAQNKYVYNCDEAYTAKAIDWVGANASKFNIRVAIMAFSRCGDDDGTSALAQQANYLSALGVVVAASYANAANSPDCQTVAGDKVTKAPGSASFALTVNASDDKGTVSRTNDTIWDKFLIGPRKDFTVATPNLLALKPDLAAPGKNLSTLELYNNQPTVFSGIEGTSPAAAIAAGAAALIIQKYPAITPDSIKDLLISSVDSSRNANPYYLNWDNRLGWGLLNVGHGLQLAQIRANDVSFPTCQSPSTAGNGQPCSLSDGNPNWLNTADITTASTPHAGVANTISVNVINRGNAAATVLVNFGVYDFGAGTAQFHHLGSQQVTLQAHQTLPVTQAWTPASSDHQCVQVSLSYGLDADYSNNVTQRNIQISPSVYKVRVENPLMVPAHFAINAKSDRAGWICRVSDPAFDLDPFNDCARNVKVTFDAPAGTPVGQRANCNIAIRATPKGEKEGRLIGGVTVQTYVPKPCRITGEIVNEKGTPVVGAVVSVARAAPTGDATMTHFTERAVTTQSNADGVFTMQVIPQVLQTITVRSPAGKQQLTLRPECGLSLPRLVLTRKEIKAVDRLTGLPVTVEDGYLIPMPAE